MAATNTGATARLGIGLAAAGRPAYLTIGHGADQGDDRSVAGLRGIAERILDDAWAAGLRHIDVARSYGLGERFVGGWLRAHPERRAELTIGSKWGYRYVGGWRTHADVHEIKDHSVEAFREQWPETLAELGGAPDLYLIHSVTPESPALADAELLDELGRLADTGVRVGISTSGARQADVVDAALAVGGPFSALQATWNPLEPSVGGALARASEAGWHVTVKEAVANGRLAPAGDAAGIAADGFSADAVALAAALSLDAVDIVLSGAATPAQLASNLAAQAVPAATIRGIVMEPEAPERYWAERSSLRWT